VETPERIAKMYGELFSGIGEDPGRFLKTLSGESHEEIILAKDIPMFSICEHHLLPFQGVAHIALHPQGPDRGASPAGAGLGGFGPQAPGAGAPDLPGGGYLDVRLKTTGRDGDDRGQSSIA